MNFDNYHLSDFSTILKNRKDGVTETSFFEDVEIWQRTLYSLPNYNENSIKEEIDTMNLEIPLEEYDLEKMSKVYSRLVSYRIRIVEITFVLNSHVNIFEKAYKTLKSSAMVLYAGTVKDKEANAESMVQPLLLGFLKVKNLLDYVMEVRENIEFASMNMARLLREKESLSKINQGYNNIGNQGYM